MPLILSYLTEQGFLLLAPINCSLKLCGKTVCHTALVGSGSVASHDSWWHEEPGHLLSSPCQASLNNVGLMYTRMMLLILQQWAPSTALLLKWLGIAFPLAYTHTAAYFSLGPGEHICTWFITARSPGVLVRRTVFWWHFCHILAGWPWGSH